MSWGSLITTGLKLLLALLQWANNSKLISAGEDKAIAAASKDLLMSTAEGKKLREWVKSRSDEQSKELSDFLGSV